MQTGVGIALGHSAGRAIWHDTVCIIDGLTQFRVRRRCIESPTVYL